MKYYFIDTLGELTGGYCILASPPEGLGLSYYRMAKGEPIQDKYPEDARIYMSEKMPGIKVPSIVGNTHNYLITSKPAKDEIAAHCQGVEIEVLPITLYNHKKRPHPGEYFIINPIGTRDCLDLGASAIEYLDEPGDPYHGAIVGVDRFVLDPQKLVAAPALFRVREDPNKYVVDERLAGALRALGLTNLVLTEVEQRQ
ncbi:DUF1629 domain-containing protein [Sorangium sp. So ce367]|uniref:imm11 family protein n=1 Tax=Sorangium sp. So ce367 TaxID=3133305 RepID=UPI003F6160ED